MQHFLLEERAMEESRGVACLGCGAILLAVSFWFEEQEERRAAAAEAVPPPPVDELDGEPSST